MKATPQDHIAAEKLRELEPVGPGSRSTASDFARALWMGARIAGTDARRKGYARRAGTLLSRLERLGLAHWTLAGYMSGAGPDDNDNETTEMQA